MAEVHQTTQKVIRTRIQTPQQPPETMPRDWRPTSSHTFNPPNLALRPPSLSSLPKVAPPSATVGMKLQMSEFSWMILGVNPDVLRLYSSFQIVECPYDTPILALALSHVEATAWPMFSATHLHRLYYQACQLKTSHIGKLLTSLYEVKLQNPDIRQHVKELQLPQHLNEFAKAARHAVSTALTPSMLSGLNQAQGINQNLMQAFAISFGVVIILWSSSGVQAFFPQETDVAVLHLYHVNESRYLLLEHAELQRLDFTMLPQANMACMTSYVLHFPAGPVQQSHKTQETKDYYELIQKLLGIGVQNRSISDAFYAHYIPPITEADLFRLCCGHDVLRKATLTALQEATSGYFLASEYDNFKSLQCPVCPSVIQEADIMQLLGDSLHLFINSREERRVWYLKEIYAREGLQDCQTCKSPKKLECFKLCKHTCIECSYQMYPQGFTCSICKRPVDEVAKNWLDNIFSKPCDFCHTSTIPGSQLAIVECESHRLCLKCLTSRSSTSCLLCSRQYSPEEMEKLEALLPKCRTCKQNIKPENRVCACLCCDDCQRKECLSQRRTTCYFCDSSFPPLFHEKLRIEVDELKNEDRTSNCKICYGKFFKIDLVLLQCRHFLCRECLGNLVDNGYFNSYEHPCPENSCRRPIEYSSICNKIPQDIFEKFEKKMLIGLHNLVDCPRCNSRYSLPPDRPEFFCENCSLGFCSKCLRPPHPSIADCSQVDHAQIMKFLENEGSSVSECPGCYRPYTKDNSCDHVKCTFPECGIEFCFSCSCLREPTLEHGNHFHRPDCRFYAAYDGEDLPRPNSCRECAKTPGQLCPRPPQLEEPRKFKK